MQLHTSYIRSCIPVIRALHVCNIYVEPLQGLSKDVKWVASTSQANLSFACLVLLGIMQDHQLVIEISNIWNCKIDIPDFVPNSQDVEQKRLTSNQQRLPNAQWILLLHVHRKLYNTKSTLGSKCGISNKWSLKEVSTNSRNYYRYMAGTLVNKLLASTSFI